MTATGHDADVVVVGAGPAGSLLGIYLARRGRRVRVVERRADPRLAGHADDGRSINLGLSQRGIRALRDVGLLERLWPLTVPMRGRVVHGPGGVTFQPYGTAADQILHSVLRRDLTVLLIDAAEREHGVRFEFGHRLVALDKNGPAVRVAGERTGDERRLSAGLVVGADGAFSTVRAQMHHGERADLHQQFLDWGYQELTIPAPPGGRADRELHALHVWPGGGQGLMVAHPNRDGSLTASLFLPFDRPARPGPPAPSFAALRTGQQVRSFFDEVFPDVPALVPDLVEQVLAQPVGSLPSVRTAPWRHRGTVVLVGDAAHAVYPFYGQGMNAAFEDCTVLDDCLARHPHDPAAALRDYELRRRPHTDVLAELAERNFVELRDRLRSPLFRARKRVDLVLNRLFPRTWTPLYTMVAHSAVPYADAVVRARRQDAALVTAATGVAVAGAVAVTAVAGRQVRKR